MAAHSSILPWKIPWTEQPDGLQSRGSQCQTPRVPYKHSFQAGHQAQGPESLYYVVWIQH